MSLSQNLSIPLSILPRDTPPSSPDARRKRSHVDLVEKVDWISNLPDDVLLVILEKASTEKAITTSLLSKRWKDLWKHRRYVEFSMNKFSNFNENDLANKSESIAEMITKVVNNLNGDLIHFKTPYFSCNSKDASWIRTLIHVKHTHCLTLENPLSQGWVIRRLYLPPGIFSHPTLAYLSLTNYTLKSARAFNSCKHLCVLVLEDLCVEICVLNKIIASCSSLKSLVLKIMWHDHKGCIKIHNNNLKLLRLGSAFISLIEVCANSLDVLALEFPFVSKDNITLTAPRLESFNKIFSVLFEVKPHLSYNISCDAQDVAHDFVVSGRTRFLKRYTSLEVSVDLMNPMEVEKLKDVLLAWNAQRDDLGIIFKHNNVPKKKGEVSIGGAQKKKWEEVLNADFGVNVVSMYNFSGSNEEEFAFASRLVTQGVVVKMLKIETTSVSACKKLEIETAVAKLMKLPKGNKELVIECF